MKAKEIYEVNIMGLDHYGRGIAKRDSYIIFVPFCYPGDVVKIEIERVKKNIVEAKCIDYIVQSSSHITPICPYFYSCGGCDLMHLSYLEQMKFKQNKIKEIMEKFSTLDTSFIQPFIACEVPLYYRNKVTFHVKETIGFYGKKSYDLIPVNYCFLLHDKMNEILKKIKETVNLKKIKQIVIRYSYDYHESMVVFYTQNINVVSTFIDALTDEDNMTVLVHTATGEKCLYGKGYILEKMDKFVFRISASSFFQVNTNQAIRLYQKVKEKCHLTKTESVLDLYCGTGTIGIFLSDMAKEVIGIERNEKAVEDAIKNKALNHISNIKFLCGDVGTLLKQNQFLPDIVIVDPPRGGLDHSAMTQLFALHPQKIIYVSCDPITLMRDLNTLSKVYQVEELTGFDMFPQTYHVECVCVMSRR